jgi:hypothetical protein
MNDHAQEEYKGFDYVSNRIPFGASNALEELPLLLRGKKKLHIFTSISG